MTQELETIINKAWDERDTLSVNTKGAVRDAVDTALAGLDDGRFRVAELTGCENGPNKNGSNKKNCTVNQWLKKAVLLGFRLNPMRPISGGHGGSMWWDKVAPKFNSWTASDFEQAQLRAVPGAIVRRGAYIAPGVVLMPSFVNIGARVGAGTMVDTWASIGSCAQVGEYCHISAGAGIGGVLEPLQANPTIIEDNCFIGARSEVVEGMIVREGSVLAMGVFISQSTKIVDRKSGKIIYGEIPPYSVVVPGALPDKSSGLSLACAVIVKTVDEKTRAKTRVNELLRD